MSFLTAQTEELTATAGRLQTVGAQFVAQNAAAAGPTTGVIPAAADEVSALQASLFTAYGTLYQQVSADAAAMYDMFVNTLGVSAGTYAATEAANSAAAASPLADAVLPPPLSDLANIVNIGVGNWASASSNFIGLANGGLLLPIEQGAAATEAAAPGLGGGGPVAAGMGGASSIGALSAPATLAASSGPPTWAASAVSNLAAPRAVGWTAAAPQAAAPTTFLPGMPGMVSTGRNSAGFGAPRYGVKPLVMAATQI